MDDTRETGPTREGWLGFEPPVAISTTGDIHFYRTRDLVTRAPRVVAVSGPNADRAAVAALFDAVAACHRVLDHPNIPRTAERGASGDVEFLAFESDAMVRFSDIRTRFFDDSKRRPRYEELLAMGEVGFSAYRTAHRTMDPEDGLPIAIGRTTWEGVWVSRDGKISMIGFGWKPKHAITWGAGTEAVVAPEVASGARPTPASDVYVSISMFAPYMGATVLPPVLVRALAGDPELLWYTEAVSALGRDALQIVPALRTPSFDVITEQLDALYGRAGIVSDPVGLERLLAGIVRDYCETVASPRGRTSASVPDTPPGMSIGAGRYQVRRVLGKGGMGSVVLAWDRQLRQQVVVKTLLDSVSESLRDRFAREVRLLREVSHPHVIRGYDIVEEAGGLHAIMEFVDGDRLDVAIQRRKPMSSELLGWLAEVADALAALHARSIVHRDVKPSNIMIAARGAVLIDLGIAHEAASDLTLTNVAVGTPSFMAPEQLAGEVGPEVDVYALGLVIREAFGLPKLAPLGATVSPWTRVRQLGLGDLPQPLQAIILECLDPDRRARPTAADLARRLELLAQAA